MSEVATIDGYQISSNEQSAEQITADIAAIDAPAAAEAAEKSGTPESEASKTLQARKTGLERRRGSIQAEIDTATAQKYEAQRERDIVRREADIARREVEQARAEREALKAPAAEKPAETKKAYAALVDDDPNDPKPKQDDYEDYADFIYDGSAWAARKTFAAEQARITSESQRSAAAHARQARMTAFNERVETVKAQHADYETRTAHLILSRPMQDVIVDDPAFALYLADHVDDYQRIRGMASETAQYGELMRLRGRLEAASDRGPAVKVSPKSTAPAPIKPLASTPAAVLGDGEPDPEDTSPGAQARFDAYWNRRAATR